MPEGLGFVPAAPIAVAAPAHATAVLRVDLAAVVENWRRLGVAHGGRPVAAVVKADAYGLGAARVAAALHAAGCATFFVATLDEGLALRPLLPGAVIAALNGLLPGAEEDYAAAAIDPVLGSLAEIDAWAASARRAGRSRPALLHVDTGLARLGLPPDELAALAAAPDRLTGITLRYVMSHLASSERADDPANERQRARFATACAILPPAPRSLANSSGIFLGPDYATDLARPGAALYGMNPTPGAPCPMRPALHLAARVLQLRHVAAGEAIGYNATWIAPRPSRIATVGLGYADGWHRAQSNRGAACFDGKVLPLVGRVSMDLTMFDATDVPGLAVGNWLDLIGPGRPLEDVACAAGTSAYEVLTALGARIRRVWHG